MFGFPTRERPLYMGEPKDLRSRDDVVVATRALDMALSSFAPGAEITKNKATHVCVGFAAYKPRFGEMKPVDPLQSGVGILRCLECDAVEPAPEPSDDPCDVCDGARTWMMTYQPAGFRTDFQPRDYDDSGEMASRASRPQLSWKQDATATQLGAVSASALEGRELYTVNDRDGELFAMHRASDGTYVVATPDLYDSPPNIPAFAGRAPDKQGAIGAVKPTDVLLLDLNALSLPGGPGRLVMDRYRPFVASALWSYAEILRVAAADLLSIDPRELDVGLQPVATPDGPSRRIFLADRLDNGAGYARHLAQPEVLARLLDHAVDVIGRSFVALDHAGRCDAACPDCLASYDNRFLHPHLDWRLGTDVAELAAGRPLNQARWLDSAESIAQATADGFGLDRVDLGALPGLRDPDSGNIVILNHPMWLVGAAAARNPAQRAAERAANGGLAFHVDLHTTLRYPQQLVPLLEADRAADSDGPWGARRQRAGGMTPANQRSSNGSRGASSVEARAGGVPSVPRPAVGRRAPSSQGASTIDRT
jgi:DEAD/DEAH box helicase domain-containing protein